MLCATPFSLLIPLLLRVRLLEPGGLAARLRHRRRAIVRSYAPAATNASSNMVTVSAAGGVSASGILRSVTFVPHEAWLPAQDLTAFGHGEIDVGGVAEVQERSTTELACLPVRHASHPRHMTLLEKLPQHVFRHGPVTSYDSAHTALRLLAGGAHRPPLPIVSDLAKPDVDPPILDLRAGPRGRLQGVLRSHEGRKAFACWLASVVIAQQLDRARADTRKMFDDVLLRGHVRQACQETLQSALVQFIHAGRLQRLFLAVLACRRGV
mmetsp:Transcript_49623/g.98089  ORF Transcript_49623/g.98089 Transcript_49623/m.98089 type:complete len:267 (-) Transcript_49623:253-1053(-)